MRKTTNLAIGALFVLAAGGIGVMDTVANGDYQTELHSYDCIDWNKPAGTPHSPTAAISEVYNPGGEWLATTDDAGGVVHVQFFDSMGIVGSGTTTGTIPAGAEYAVFCAAFPIPGPPAVPVVGATVQYTEIK